jgi:hypothetical protein
VAFTAAAGNLQAGGLSADEVRALTAEMMADADRASSFASMPGWDAASTVELTGGMQFRYFANFRDEEDVDDDGIPANQDDFDSGFQFASTELMFAGTVGDDEVFDYYIQALVGADGNFALDDAWIGYRFGNNWTLQMGQIAVPFWRELLIDDVYQLAVDRSLLFANTGPILTQGFSFIYQDDTLRGWLQFSDGIGGQNTSLTDNATTPFFNPGGGESDYAVTGRLEYKGAGDWRQFDDFTSAPGSEFAWLLGGAAIFTGGEPANDNEYTGFGWTADFSVEGDGWNAYAAYVGFYTDVEQDAPLDDVDFTDHGLLVQGGVFIPDTDWEVFGRWDAIIPDGDRDGDDMFNTITAGANYYIHGHAAKFTADVQWSLDAATDNDIVQTQERFGFLGDDDDNEIAIRAQFQLMF